MTTTVIIDAAVVVILMSFALIGAKRGLFRALAGLVILVLSLVGAGMLATSFAPPLADMVTPALENYVSRQVESAFATQFDGAELTLELPDLERLELSQLEDRLEGLLEQLGVDAEDWGTMTEEIRSNIAEGGAAVQDAVLEAVAGPLVEALMYGVVYILAFILLMVLLHVLFGAMGLVAKLPGLRSLNTLGGGILGLAEGILVVFLGVWVARRMGVSFDSEALAEAHILHMFTANSPLNALAFLNC